jgi:hypothetical protein
MQSWGCDIVTMTSLEKYFILAQTLNIVDKGETYLGISVYGFRDLSTGLNSLFNVFGLQLGVILGGAVSAFAIYAIYRAQRKDTTGWAGRVHVLETMCLLYGVVIVLNAVFLARAIWGGL